MINHKSKCIKLAKKYKHGKISDKYAKLISYQLIDSFWAIYLEEEGQFVDEFMYKPVMIMEGFIDWLEKKVKRGLGLDYPDVYREFLEGSRKRTGLR
tara:strand:+ start:352 stop:642 length:291 start_codon:yes stop_codon:yes gene_type:complete